MTGIAAFMLFGIALGAALWTLVASIRPQLHRFAELFASAPAAPPADQRLSRLSVRAIPARPARHPPLRAAA